MTPRFPLILALATVACAGGGGALSQSLQTQDDAPISNEGAATSTEGTASSTERAGSSQESPRTNVESSPGAGGFTCGGTYVCTINGQASDVPVILVPSGSGCTAAGDDDGTVIQSDGSIVQKGKVVASWTRTGSGFSYSSMVTSKGTTVTLTIACDKVSDDTTSTSTKTKSRDPSSSSSTRDAG